MSSPIKSALLIVDVINPFDYVGGLALLRQTRRIVPELLSLRRHFDRHDAPVVYCNDNFGQWRSDFRSVVASCAAPAMRGADITQALEPRRDDYFILKPKHSSFFATPLDLLLRSMDVERLFIAGIAGDACVHSTASDAHMLDYAVYVVTDAVASPDRRRNARALATLRDAKSAKLTTTMGAARLLRG